MTPRLLRLRRAWAGRTAAVPAALERAWREPLPRGTCPVRGLRFLACDAEMTGLDPQRDSLLSLGWVPIDDGELRPARAGHVLLRPGAGVGQSATIHHLRDCTLRDGVTGEIALTTLLDAAVGRILVFHNARLDTAFLDTVSRAVWSLPMLLPCVDTLRMEERTLRRRDRPMEAGALQLRSCRARYHLPSHRAHSAVTDAMATGELLLAQLAWSGPGLRLRDLT